MHALNTVTLDVGHPSSILRRIRTAGQNSWQRFRSSGNPTTILVSLVCAGVVLAMLYRMRHGVDFWDESFYVAQPLRYVLGDRPVVDERILLTSSLLLYPVVKLYTLLLGGTAGIFWCMRLLYLAFFGFVGWAAYGMARQLLPRDAARLVGAACLCFLPLGIPGLSYNTLGMGFLSIGLFVATRWLLTPTPDRGLLQAPLFWAGVAQGAAIAAYPPLALAGAGMALAIALLVPTGKRRALLRYVAGGVALGFLLLPWIVFVSLSQWREAWLYSAIAHFENPIPTRLFRFRELATSFFWQQPQLRLAALATVLAIPFMRRWPWPTGLLLPFLPLLAHGSLMVINECAAAGPCHGFISACAVMALILLPGLRDARTATVLGLGGIMPACVAGLATAWSSTHAARNAAIGLFPAAILFLIVLTMMIEECARRTASPALRTAARLGPAVFIVSLLAYVLAPNAYLNDGPRGAMTALVTDGPYKGIFTTPQKHAELAAIAADIHTHQQGDRALFYYEFPAGYVIANCRPITPSVWTSHHGKRPEFDAQTFRDFAQAGQLVIRFGSPGDFPLDQAVGARCDVVAQRPNYTVLRVR